MKFVKEFIVPAAVLTVICLVISAALVLTYDTTKPIIEAARAAEADKARIEVLSTADKFEKVSVSGVEGVVEAYKATNGAGYVITTFAKGYGGPVNVMTGIKSDGTIDKVKLMENSETPGLGSRVGESEYTSQYSNKDYNLDGVNAITGATISSTAFKTAVGTAFTAYGQLAGVEIEVEEPKSPQEQIFPENTAELVEFELEGAKRAYVVPGHGLLVVAEAKGYSGAPSPMEVYVGIGIDMKIAGVALGENSETAGLGTQVGEEGYTSQYVGKDNLDGITAVSGATESSNGFKKAVQSVLDLMPALEEKMAEASKGA
ncbi:MAG: FMN-binding protein [Angelakisella sp.]|nr:FMN-binding protein [Angelakisella sp.]